MILVLVNQIYTAQSLLKSASVLAQQLDKSFGVLCFVDNDDQISNCEFELKAILPDTQINVRNKKNNTISLVCDEFDASFLFVQLQNQKHLRSYLKDCRDLRIPYLFFKDTFSELNLSKVILPIGFLEEELEKAQFASAFGRFCGSEIYMLLANDYGSKAATIAEKMQLLFQKFDFKYTLQKAIKDSFRVEDESIKIATSNSAGLVIISASREYGLDDILFGPKEFRIVKRSLIPVLIINPRGDLYALCD
jgi:hypothetical protein